MSYQLLRQVVAEKISQNDEAIGELRAQNEQLRRDLASLDSPALVPVPVVESEGGESEEDLPYAFLGPQEAVLRFLMGNPGPHRTKGIRDAVIARGMKSDSKAPHSVVYTALKRLSGKHEVEKMAGGRWRAISPSASA